jgi:hypothetical protein
LSFIVWFRYPEEKIETAKWKLWVIVPLLSISIFTAGLTFELPYFLKSKPETHKFFNQNIINTELSNYIRTSPDKTYLVFCFSYTCPYCWNSIENLRQYAKTNMADSVIVLAVGNQEDKLVFEQNFKPDFTIKDLSVEAMDSITYFYPTAFYIVHDTIRVIIQSELPSPFVFKQSYILPEEKVKDDSK